MPVAGVVAEYNPFHTGHQYHLAQTRRALGPDGCIVAVMSGHWVQRGQCAITDKWTRARCAVEYGADLVLELPTVFACAGAETFARGAIELLRATGVVDALSFGSESGDADTLCQIARCLNSPAFADAHAAARADKALSYAQARQRAVEALLGARHAALLAQPNSNLAVEYLRNCGQELRPLVIPRIGAAHDADGAQGGYRSASSLRALLLDGAYDRAAPFLPAPPPADGELADMRRGERAILARMRGMTAADWAQLPDSGGAEGLPDRLVSAARGARSLDEFYTLAKARRYSHARLRRLSVWALLGAPDPGSIQPHYLRVLAFNDRGRALLARMRTSATLPVLTKPTHARRLAPQARAQFEAECRYTDLYTLFLPAVGRTGLEWTRTPHYARSDEGSVSAP